MKHPVPVLACPALLLAGVLSAATDTAVPPDAEKHAELVRRLGSSDFATREQASRALFRIGLPAREAISAGAAHPDAEVRRRCRELLPAIVEADRQARLAAFIADKEGKRRHDLPGWERFRKAAGEDAAARQLFVAVTRRDEGFFRDADRDPEHAGERCASLCQSLLFRRNQLAMGGGPLPHTVAEEELAPLFLIAADPRVRLPAQNRYALHNFLYQPAVQNALRGGSAPLKKIVLAWMERQLDDEASTSILFNAINNLQLKETLDLALKVIRDKKLKGPGLAPALVTVGKFGDKQHLPLLESFLENKEVIGGFGFGLAGGGNVNGTTQVRDAALAMLVRLTKQSHKDYGFAFTKANLTHMIDYANCLGFGSDAERDRAFARWKEWKAAQKK